MLYKIMNTTKKSTKSSRPMVVLEVSPISEDGEILPSKKIFQFRNFLALRNGMIAEISTRKNNNGFDIVTEIDINKIKANDKLAASADKTSIVGHPQDLLTRYPEGKTINHGGVRLRSTGVTSIVDDATSKKQKIAMEFVILRENA